MRKKIVLGPICNQVVFALLQNAQSQVSLWLIFCKMRKRQ